MLRQAGLVSGKSYEHVMKELGMIKKQLLPDHFRASQRSDTRLSSDPPYAYPILILLKPSASNSTRRSLPHKLLVWFLSPIQSVPAANNIRGHLDLVSGHLKDVVLIWSCLGNPSTSPPYERKSPVPSSALPLQN